MACLNAEQILKADDLPREKVDVPEWGKDGFVFIRTMTSEEGDQFDDEIYKLSADNKKVEFVRSRITARLCVRTICDQAGKRLFNDKQIDKLGQKSARALNRCYQVAERLNGLGRYRENIEKNSEPAGGDGSSSGPTNTDAQ
jgi:hypothetical protein